MNLSKKTFKSQDGKWYIVDTENALKLKAKYGVSDKIIAERSGMVSASVVQRFYCLCRGEGADGTLIKVDMIKAAQAVGLALTGDKNALLCEFTNEIEGAIYSNRDLPGIKSAYYSLSHILSDMVKTEFYNLSPEECGRTGYEWYEERVQELKIQIKTNFLGSPDVKEKLCDITDEVYAFIHSCSLSNGVADRWIELNPRLTYYDPAYEIYESNRKLYKDIVNGKYKYENKPISFSVSVTEESVEERKEYFKAVQKKYARRNEEYNEDKAFSDEMANTLELIFRKEFAEQLKLI